MDGQSCRKKEYTTAFSRPRRNCGIISYLGSHFQIVQKQMVEERQRLLEEKKREEERMEAQLTEMKKEKTAMDMNGDQAAEKLANVHGE